MVGTWTINWHKGNWCSRSQATVACHRQTNIVFLYFTLWCFSWYHNKTIWINIESKHISVIIEASQPYFDSAHLTNTIKVWDNGDAPDPLENIELSQFPFTHHFAWSVERKKTCECTIAWKVLWECIHAAPTQHNYNKNLDLTIHMQSPTVHIDACNTFSYILYTYICH